eukprot:5622914-Amphidinium_carterae.1
MTHELALVNRTEVSSVWTDGSQTGRHSSEPQHRRCGVGYYTDTHERVWLPLPGLKQSVYRAEFLAVVRALEECHPHDVVSHCKGVVKAVQALQTGPEDLKVVTGTLSRERCKRCFLDSEAGGLETS